MKNFLIKILANIVFLFHCFVVLTVLFGWLAPSAWYWYVGVLIMTLTFDMAFGYCFLSRIEFMLRKKLDPSLDYDYSFSSYYTYKLTRTRLSENFISNVGFAFILASLAINIGFWLFA